MRKLVSVVIAAVIASTAMAADMQKSAVKIPSVKAGKCSVTLLDKDGIKPLANAELKLQSVKDSKKVITAQANKAGVCVLKNIESGRYVMSVNGKVLSLFDVAQNGQLAWCRIVVSDQPMLVGGQAEAGAVAEEDDDSDKGGFIFMGLSGKTAVGAAVAAGILVAGGVGWGGYEIYDHNRDDDNDETPPGASK